MVNLERLQRFGLCPLAAKGFASIKNKTVQYTIGILHGQFHISRLLIIFVTLIPPILLVLDRFVAMHSIIQ